ncbi:ABC transporter substrate-binding protein [Microbacterium invictum]|nr:extracellular solute-binding protein [Microbacterium invictum]
MKLSKRMPAVLAAGAAAALVLAGCSGSSDLGVSGAGSNLLTISWKGSEKAGIDAVVAAYKEQNPDAEIVVTIADTEQYQATLRTQLAAGSAADVMYIWPADGNPGALLQIAPGGFLEPLTDREWADDYPQFIEDQLSYDGDVYLMGNLVNAFGAMYNQSTLDETGLTPPGAWPDVIPFCEAAIDAGKVAYAVGGATLNNVQNALYSIAPTTVYGENPDFDEQIAAGDTSFSEEPGYVEAFDKYQQMIDAGCFNSDATGVNNDGMLAMVADGSAIGTMPSALQLSALRTLVGDDQITFAPFSGGDDAETGILAAASSGGAGVNTNAKNKEMALEFVDFLGSTEGAQAYVQAMKGPVAALQNPDIDPGPDALTLITDYIEQERTVHFLNQYWPNARIEQAMFSGLQGMLTGDTTAEEALEGMDSEYTR